MSRPPAPEVFTTSEVARAAGVPRRAVEARIAASGMRPIAGTRFFSSADALSLTRALSGQTPTASSVPARLRFPTLVSLGVHTAVLLLILAVTATSPGNAATEMAHEDARMVFLVTPGPGGGGGGGGLRDPLPAPKVERHGPEHALSVPKVKPDPVLTTVRRIEEPRKPTPAVAPVQPEPIDTPPDPLPSRVLVAPVVQSAANARDREGVIERPRADANSQGSGAGGGAGSGQGTGNGEGLGAGIGNGSGGGTGGGPFRPGSGIAPPRLLREVKAAYTEDARRRGIAGDVEMEIVVQRDGSVGDVHVLRGLGGGLDERAIAAVKQWRFAPATRKGEAVDVIVEVAVEFTLR